MRAIALQVASPALGQTRVVHCRCGAIRHAPIGLTVVSCVRCGAGMGSTLDMRQAIPPARGLLALATFPSQLLGTMVFALAVVRMVTIGVDGLSIAVLSAAAAWVFAGGAAHRGSLLALSLCAAFNIGISILLLAPIAEVGAFLAPMLAKVSAKQFELGKIVVVGIAAIAAVECFVAVPQARAFAKWRDSRAQASPRFSTI